MLADPLLTEHYAKAGLGAVLIDQQHGLYRDFVIWLIFTWFVVMALGWIAAGSVYNMSHKYVQMEILFFEKYLRCVHYNWHFLLRSLGRANRIWVCSAAWEVSNLFSNCPGCRQHPGTHQVKSSMLWWNMDHLKTGCKCWMKLYKCDAGIWIPDSGSNFFTFEQPCSGRRGLRHRGPDDQHERGCWEARRTVQVLLMMLMLVI